MENKTCFDLNGAIENWRAELAAQSDLTTEVRRELETHLRDSVAELGRRGLNEEEAFWVARRRVGRPGQLGEEFAKADPTAVWRERVFWTALAVLVAWLWNTSAGILSTMASKIIYNLAVRWNSPHGWLVASTPAYILYILFYVLPICVLMALVAKGRVNSRSGWISFFCQRSRIIVVSGIWVLLLAGFTVLVSWNSVPIHYVHVGETPATTTTMTMTFPLMQNLVNALTLPVMFLALTAWLMPPRFRTVPKTA